MRTTTVKPPTTKRKNAAYNRFAMIDTENKMERKWRGGKVIPKEEQDQMALAELLDALHLVWFHVPNEIKAKPQYYAKRAKLGVKSGALDNFIFNPPPCDRTSKGAVIELKRIVGGRVSQEQIQWIDNLNKLGWKTAICYGIDDAIKQLKVWGYM
jgi:hypothetical protein